MTRHVVGIVLLILAALIIYDQFSERQHRIDQQTAKISELEAKLKTVAVSDESQRGSLQDQAFCAQRAERAFQSADWVSDSKMSVTYAYFVSHYQPSPSRCLIEVDTLFTERSTGESVKTRYVGDAISGEELGEYMQVWAHNGKVNLAECFMTDARRQAKYCGSDEEFTNLARQYMK